MSSRTRPSHRRCLDPGSVQLGSGVIFQRDQMIQIPDNPTGFRDDMVGGAHCMRGK
jgi:hypothetical protein